MAVRAKLQHGEKDVTDRGQNQGVDSSSTVTGLVAPLGRSIAGRSRSFVSRGARRTPGPERIGASPSLDPAPQAGQQAFPSRSRALAVPSARETRRLRTRPRPSPCQRPASLLRALATESPAGQTGSPPVAFDGLLDGLLVKVLELELRRLGLLERVLLEPGGRALKVDVVRRQRHGCGGRGRICWRSHGGLLLLGGVRLRLRELGLLLSLGLHEALLEGGLLAASLATLVWWRSVRHRGHERRATSDACEGG